MSINNRITKDPAFLFYYQDFLVGVSHMSDEQIGQYIQCLCHQANRGSVRVSHMINICRTQDNFNVVCEKFDKIDSGEYANVRLQNEIERRRNYCDSRRTNRQNKNKVIVTKEVKVKTKPKPKVIKKTYDFESVWEMYPKKIGKKEALGYFNVTVKKDEDYLNIIKSVKNYIEYIDKENIDNKYIKNGCNWFADWESWEEGRVFNLPKPKEEKNEALEKMKIWEKERDEELKKGDTIGTGLSQNTYTRH